MRRVSHFPRQKHEDSVCSLVIQETEFGNARQERVNSDPTAKMKASYERVRANSLHGKRRQRPLQRHSFQEPSTNETAMFNTDEEGSAAQATPILFVSTYFVNGH